MNYTNQLKNKGFKITYDIVAGITSIYIVL